GTLALTVGAGAASGHLTVENIVSGGNVALTTQGALSDIVLRGAISATGGSLNLTLDSANQVRTPSGATLVLDGGASGLLATVGNGRTWQNDGTIILKGTSTIRLPNAGGYATFNNAAGGVLNVDSTAGWSFISDPSVQGGVITNAGTINVNNSTSWEAAF